MSGWRWHQVYTKHAIGEAPHSSEVGLYVGAARAEPAVMEGCGTISTLNPGVLLGASTCMVLDRVDWGGMATL